VGGNLGGGYRAVVRVRGKGPGSFEIGEKGAGRRGGAVGRGVETKVHEILAGRKYTEGVYSSERIYGDRRLKI